MKKINWYAWTVGVIVSGTAIIVFWDSFSWSSGGMNGLISFLVVSVAIFAIIVVSLIALVIKLTQSREKKATTNVARRKSPSELIESKNREVPKWEKRLPIISALGFGFLFVLFIVLRFAFESQQPYGEWKVAWHPRNDRIKEIVSSDTDFLIIKGESGRSYLTKLSLFDETYCRDHTISTNCWDTHLNYWTFNEIDATQEEDVHNNMPCPGKAHPPVPPVERSSQVVIFRDCNYGGSIRELRLFISKDGDLWYWSEYIMTTSNYVLTAVSTSCIVFPVGALFGVLLAWVFTKIRDNSPQNNS